MQQLRIALPPKRKTAAKEGGEIIGDLPSPKSVQSPNTGRRRKMLLAAKQSSSAASLLSGTGVETFVNGAAAFLPQ